MGWRPLLTLSTCIEVAEHFVEPALEFETLFAHGRTVLLSTVLVPDPPPPPDAWDYYALDGGQHVALYTLDTLSAIANTLACNSGVMAITCTCSAIARSHSKI